MAPDAGWRPLASGDRVGAAAFAVSPFTRLARTHAFAVAGDTLVAIALAGSIFFSIDLDEARWRVALFLVLTMAPFAVMAPLVGPALDRSSGGRRWMVVASNTARALLCILLVDDIDGLLLFPEAFAVLVLQKAYHVAKSAIVPTTVASDEELVQANSKLALLSGIIGAIAAAPGGLAYALGGSEAVLVLAVVVFGAGAVVALRIPATTVAAEPATQAEHDELRGGAILLAASAMGLLRGIVGFVTFLLAFALRGGDAPKWHFGVVVAVAAVAAMAGSALAPVLRRTRDEESILVLSLGVAGVVALVAAYVGDLPGAALLAGAVGVASAGGKQAFDALVQRDAPDANRGRSFARFETRFQLVWVVGALVPVAISMPARAGSVLVAGAAAFAAFSYVGGRRALAARRGGGSQSAG